jgi:hypothetical protein
MGSSQTKTTTRMEQTRKKPSMQQPTPVVHQVSITRNHDYAANPALLQQPQPLLPLLLLLVLLLCSSTVARDRHTTCALRSHIQLVTTPYDPPHLSALLLLQLAQRLMAAVAPRRQPLIPLPPVLCDMSHCTLALPQAHQMDAFAKPVVQGALLLHQGGLRGFHGADLGVRGVAGVRAEAGSGEQKHERGVVQHVPHVLSNVGQKKGEQ